MNEKIQKIMDQIILKETEEDLIQRVSEGIYDFLDNDWENDGYETEWEWYVEYGRNGSEDNVIVELINEYSKGLTFEEYCSLHDEIQKQFLFLADDVISFSKQKEEDVDKLSKEFEDMTW